MSSLLNYYIKLHVLYTNKFPKCGEVDYGP